MALLDLSIAFSTIHRRFTSRAHMLAWPSCNRGPRHGDEDSGFHGLDEGYGLVDGLSPAFLLPTQLAADLALLEVGELPEMVDGVEVADLDKPGTNALHDLAAGLEAAPPVGLPLKQVTRV